MSAALLASTGAMAQVGPGAGAADEWRFSAGVGVFNGPLYPGSDQSKTRAVPVLSANYGRYFIGGIPGAGVPLGLGVNLIDDANWRLAVVLGGNLSSPRKESDSPQLQGMGDIDATALAAVVGSYSHKWFAARVGVLSDIGGHGQGIRVSLDLDARYKLTDQLILSAGPGLTWANTSYTQTFFGVSGAQSLASGLAAYTPDGGVNMLRFNMAANYQLTPQWGLSARAALGSLRGDAVNSPITETKTQNTIGLIVNYRF